MLFMQSILNHANEVLDKEWDSICKDFLEDVNKNSKLKYKGFTYLGHIFPISLTKQPTLLYLHKLIKLPKQYVEEFDQYFNEYVIERNYKFITFSNLVRRAMQYAKSLDDFRKVLPNDLLDDLGELEYVPMAYAEGISNKCALQLRKQYKDCYSLFGVDYYAFDELCRRKQ